MKISDFGLAKNICNRDYFKSEDTEKPMPIRWMSIESLHLKKFTLKSDVVHILFVWKRLFHFSFTVTNIFFCFVFNVLNYDFFLYSLVVLWSSTVGNI